MAIASRLNITRSLCEEFNTQFLYDFLTSIHFFDTPTKTILSADRTPSKYPRTTNVTVAEQIVEHIEVAGGKDQRAKAVTTFSNLTGLMFPYHNPFRKMTHETKIFHIHIMRSTETIQKKNQN